MKLIKYAALLALLLTVGSLARAQTPVNCAPSTPCTTSGPSDTNTGDEAYVAFGKVNANFSLIPTQLFQGLALPVNKGGTGVLTISGVLKGNGTGAFSAAAAADIYAPFGCSGSATTFLNGNGGCTTPAGGGNVSTSGSPVQYQTAVFSGTTTVTGIAPSSTSGEAYCSNGSSANPSFCTALAGVTSVNGTPIPASATITQTIASGTAALGTAAISSGTCATVVTSSATGVATTDTITWTFNADPTSTAGYQASVGMLTIVNYPTANNVNFKICNQTSSPITPGAVTLNWRVVR